MNQPWRVTRAAGSKTRADREPEASVRRHSQRRNRRFDDFALQVLRDVEAEDFQNRRRYIHELESVDWTGRADAGSAHHDQAFGGVIGVVGTGIVLKGVDLSRADGSHRSPAKVAEVNEKIRWRDPADRLVKRFRLKHARPDRLAVRVAQGFQFSDQLVAGCLVSIGRNQTLRLPPSHVQEEPAVVSSRAPGRGFRPVNLESFQTRRSGRLFLQYQITLLNEPFVEGDATNAPRYNQTVPGYYGRYRY